LALTLIVYDVFLTDEAVEPCTVLHAWSCGDLLTSDEESGDLLSALAESGDLFTADELCGDRVSAEDCGDLFRSVCG
jgi:hypothetical protein